LDKLKLVKPLAVMLLLAACAAGGLNNRTGPAKTVDVSQLPSIRVVGVVVSVPETLSVSEANTYKPVADIVWREDPIGDRRAQVQAIIESAAKRASAGLQGNLPVVLHLEVRKFHALTQITRYSFGGNHSIDFLLSITSGQTGDEIVPPYFVSTDLRAFGGDQAIAAEHAGQTQKVRITQHLAGLIRQELTGKPAQTVAGAAAQSN